MLKQWQGGAGPIAGIAILVTASSLLSLLSTATISGTLQTAFGSTAKKPLAVPHLLYSLSRLASRPGSAGIGGRTSA